MQLLVWAILVTTPQDTGSGFVFTPPPGWTKAENAESKITFLGPPGVGASQVQVAFYPAVEAPSATPQALHDMVFKSFADRAARHEEPSSDTVGAFRSSRAKLTHASGESVWMAVYTTKSGIDTGWAVFVAGSAELFKEHTPAVERMVRGARLACDPPPAEIHGLVIPWPKGWTRKDAKDGAVALTPPPSRGALDPTWDYTVYVMPPQALQGTLWATHRAVIDALVKQAGLADPTPPTMRADAPGPFIKSTLAARDAAGKRRLFAIYSALADGKVEWMLVDGQEDLDGLRAILSRATVKNPPRRARPKIVEAYRRGDPKSYIDREGGAPIGGGLVFDRMWLRDDGVADFTRSYGEGYANSAEALKLDPDMQNGDAGSWKAVGQEVHVVRTRGAAAEVYARDGAKLKGGGQVWQPMPSVDGIALDGAWAIKEASIEFTKAGKFRDDGVLSHAASGEGSRRPPRRGAGTFELRDFTISFLYDDGTRWSTDFSTLGTDAADLSSIVLRQSVFRRRP